MNWFKNRNVVKRFHKPYSLASVHCTTELSARSLDDSYHNADFSSIHSLVWTFDFCTDYFTGRVLCLFENEPERTLVAPNDSSHLTPCIPWSTWQIKQKAPVPGTQPIFYLFIVILMSECCILQLWGIRYSIRLVLAQWLKAESLLSTTQSVWCSSVSPGDNKIYTSGGSVCAFVWEAAGKKSSLSQWNQQWSLPRKHLLSTLAVFQSVECVLVGGPKI